jgi:secreted Zn-dependent insulinase-like peptidase
MSCTLNGRFECGIASDMVRAPIARLFVASQQFDGQTDRTEKYYGTAHRISPLSEQLLQQWSRDATAIEAAESLHLPQPNIFLPTEFELRQAHTSEVQVGVIG